MKVVPRNFLRQLKQSVHQFTAPNQKRLLTGQEAEIERLSLLSRYQETVTDLPGFPVRIPDGPSFAASWKEIFDEGIYEFNALNPSPLILDCGANVGLGCLFFKRRFPAARVTAFEADPKIFEYLRELIKGAGFADVDLIPKAVWSAATTLSFVSEGADSGRIDGVHAANTIEIQTVRLRDYLSETVDFLKVDVEGAETEVLLDSADLLSNVRNLFVEYHSFSNRPQTLDQMLRALINAGFRLQIQAVRSAKKPFLRVEEHFKMDLQLNVFGYRN